MEYNLLRRNYSGPCISPTVIAKTYSRSFVHDFFPNQRNNFPRIFRIFSKAASSSRYDSTRGRKSKSSRSSINFREEGERTGKIERAI